MGAEDAVRARLRASEEVKVVLETVSVPTSSATATTGGASEDQGAQDLHHRRILAVVSHKDDWKDTEEGRCVLFLLRAPYRACEEVSFGGSEYTSLVAIKHLPYSLHLFHPIGYNLMDFQTFFIGPEIQPSE